MDNVNTYITKHGLISLFKNNLYIGNSFADGNYWNEDTLLKLKKYINPSCNILEIGGHCGTSSILYASFIDNNSKLFVYEPQKKMFELLLKNIQQNGLETKIMPYNKGVFCIEGTAKMNNIDIDSYGKEALKRYNEETDLSCNFDEIGLEGETVNLTTIDNMNLTNIGFIHCHTQGSENFIFSKGLNTINSNKPFILYENNEIYGKCLYDNFCKSYQEFKISSEFNIKNYCLEKLNYTVIDKFNNSFDTLLIPPQNNFAKIIHITNKTINDKLKGIKKEWEILNPEYTIQLYDDEMCLDFLAKYYGEKFKDIFNYIKDGPIKSDFFRVCLLYIYGGIYVDADIKPLLPLKDYVDDDVDFMTCISYNYKKFNSIYNYNPQFIVSKKYVSELLDVINMYEFFYDNRSNSIYEYDYWKWSICILFKKIKLFEIDIESDNTFMHNKKKYKFLIEEIVDTNTNITYNYKTKNLHDILPSESVIDVYCKYKDKIVLKNFDNK